MNKITIDCSGFMIWINYTIEQQNPEYRSKFLKELCRYSLKPRKKGEPRHEGCTLELKSLVELYIEQPEQLAKLVKEGIHLMYQKQTSSKVLSSILKNI